MKKAVFLFLLLLSFISIEAQATPSNCYWGYCNNKVTGEFGGKKAAKGAIYSFRSSPDVQGENHFYG